MATKKKKIISPSRESISMTSKMRGEGGGDDKGGHGARGVAEFQSGAANQVINHSEGKGPSKNRLIRSHVNQVQARLPATPAVSLYSEILLRPKVPSCCIRGH